MTNFEIQKPVMLTMAETCKHLGIQRVSIHKYIRMGKIKSIKFFGARLIPLSEVERLLREGTN